MKTFSTQNKDKDWSYRPEVKSRHCGETRLMQERRNKVGRLERNREEERGGEDVWSRMHREETEGMEDLCRKHGYGCKLSLSVTSVCTFVDWGDVMRARGPLRVAPRGPWSPSSGSSSAGSLERKTGRENSWEEKKKVRNMTEKLPEEEGSQENKTGSESNRHSERQEVISFS